MNAVILSRIYWFTASHRLNSYLLTADENLKVYDKCNNYNGHGHDYRLEVSINGTPDRETGMILPLEKFDNCVKKILSRIDYKHLNVEVDYFKDNLSTGEIIIQFLWSQLEKEFGSNKTLSLLRFTTATELLVIEATIVPLELKTGLLVQFEFDS